MTREARAMKTTFDDYWLGYLAGHAHPLTRGLHYFGLFFGSASIVPTRSCGGRR
jgi:hypothetical protein